jgi:hypothetical protein
VNGAVVASDTKGTPASRSRRAVVIAGAVVSVGLLLSVTYRNPSTLLLVFLSLWVASPFAALLWADARAPRWPPAVGTMVQRAMLAIPIVSVAIYVVAVFGPPRAKAAFPFIALPPATWMLTALLIAVAFLTRRAR